MSLEINDLFYEEIFCFLIQSNIYTQTHTHTHIHRLPHTSTDTHKHTNTNTHADTWIQKLAADLYKLLTHINNISI